MKAIILEKLHPDAPLEVSETDVPAITAAEVLIKTAAISINPVDVKTLEDYTRFYNEQPVRASAAPVFDGVSPIILGWDLAGTVVAVGSAVSKFKAGDEVFGMIHFPGHGKVYAEYVAAPATHLALKPANINFQEAAAATLAAVTAWQGLTHNAAVKPGDRILITAPTGGVGHYAVQMARYLGAHVIVVTSAANTALVKALGADQVLDYNTFDFEKEESLQLDMVLDVGGRYEATRYQRHLKPGAIIYFLPHPLTDGEQQYYRNIGLDVRFTQVFSDEKAITDIARLLEEGRIKSYIDKIYPFSAMKTAFDAVKKSTAKGKIVIRMEE